jgi:aspartyl-tRNA(Asn)/glutamyl-tRNA(Gln) amidotransferase subunit A
VCSYKPTYGFVDCNGVLPLAPTLDHVGVIARCVPDLAAVAEAVLEQTEVPGTWQADCMAICRSVDEAIRNDKAPSHFMVLGGVFEERADPAMLAARDRLLAAVESRVTWDHDRLPALAAEMPRHLRAILATEAAAYHSERLRRRPDDYPPMIRALIKEGNRAHAVEYRRALDHRPALERAIDDMMPSPVQLLTPAATGPAPGVESTGDAVFNAHWSYTRLPTVSIPIGRHDGLPLSAQFIGTRASEERLFAAAAWVERVLGYDTKLPPAPTAPA